MDFRVVVGNELDNRKQQILKAVVADYTETGIPVGSQALASHLTAWSSATIRNDLAGLVDVGYLLQPHISAGRVPSERGYRYYIDFLMEEETVSPEVQQKFEQSFGHTPLVIDGILEASAMLLAQLTTAVSIVTSPRVLQAKVKHLDLVSLDSKHVLLILVLEGNLIRQHAIEIDRAADQEELSKLAISLNAQIPGLNAQEISELTAVQPAYPLWKTLLAQIVDSVKAIDSRQGAIIVHDGVRNLLHQPEFVDLHRLRQVLDVVEEGQMLGEVLAEYELDHGVRVLIGSENQIEQLQDCSLVITTYSAGTSRFGTMGILGPTRMRYSQIAPRLRYVALRVGKVFEHILG